MLVIGADSGEQNSIWSTRGTNHDLQQTENAGSWRRKHSKRCRFGQICCRPGVDIVTPYFSHDLAAFYFTYSQMSILPYQKMGFDQRGYETRRAETVLMVNLFIQQFPLVR